MITISFGIDCDPFCRRQPHFQDFVENLLGHSCKPVSKFFGAWEWENITVTHEQHKLIATTLIEWYNDGKCRGAFCTDLKKFI